MSGPAGGEVAYRKPRIADHRTVAVWIGPGRAEYVGGARRWAQAAAAAWGMAGAEVGLVVSELVTNAILHTRSGQPGGTVAVAVAGGWDAVTIHVHDLGTEDGQVPRPRLAAADGGTGQLAEGGRGLGIVIAVSAEWGVIPAARCPARGPEDPAAAAGGCCTWCRLVPGDGEEGHDG